jgi:hypothetical protein
VETNQKSSSRKVRWSVPRADRSVNEWLDSQWNISVSLRLLIRESIQREGYIDVMNRDVEQLPRRGRPPGPNLVQDPGQDQNQNVSDQQASEPQDIRIQKAEGSPSIEEPSETSAQDSQSSEQSPSSTKDKPLVKPTESKKKSGRASDEIMGMLGME